MKIFRFIVTQQIRKTGYVDVMAESREAAADLFEQRDTDDDVTFTEETLTDSYTTRVMDIGPVADEVTKALRELDADLELLEQTVSPDPATREDGK